MSWRYESKPPGDEDVCSALQFNSFFKNKINTQENMVKYDKDKA